MSAAVLAKIRRRRRASPWAIGGGAFMVLIVATTGGSMSASISQLQDQCQPSGASALFVSTGTSPGGLTVHGVPATPAQVETGKILLGVGNTYRANAVAETAVIYAATWENDLYQGGSANSSGYIGALQGSVSFFGAMDTVPEATSFFLGGRGYNAGGAINLSTTGVTNPVEIAVRVESPSIWPNNAYASESGYPGDAAATAEAAAWVSKLSGQVLLTGVQAQCSLVALAGPGQYVNPFAKAMPGLVSQRIDMGVDYDDVNGAPILAIGRARIVAAGTGIGGNWKCSSGSPNGGVVYQLLDGPDAGRHVYVTEDVVPTVGAGQIVAAGAEVARFQAGSGTPCIETGWSSGSGYSTEAAALGQQSGGSDPGNFATFCGQTMSLLIQSLGGKPGLLDQPKSGSSCPVM